MPVSYEYLLDDCVPVSDSSVCHSDRFFIQFTAIECAKFEITKFEPKPYDMPDIQSLLVSNSVKDIADAEDQKFLAMFDSITLNDLY